MISDGDPKALGVHKEQNVATPLRRSYLQFYTCGVKKKPENFAK